MDFITYSHRNAQTLFENDERYRDTYFELTEVIQNITDEEIIQEYEAIDRSSKKSISQPINRIIKSNLVPLGDPKAQSFLIQITTTSIFAWTLQKMKFPSRSPLIIRE